jgi:transposase
MGYIRLTLKVIDRIVESIKEGCSNKNAIARAGCSESTFYLWTNRGRDDQSNGVASIHAELVARMDEADAERERFLVQSIVQDNGWKSKAWLLERLYPDRWGTIERRDVTLRQSNHDQSTFNLSSLNSQEKENLNEILVKALGSNQDSRQA